MTAAAAHLDPDAFWSANPGPQTAFLRSNVREILYGGKGGGGKTEALLIDPLHQLKVEMERFARGEIKQSWMWAIHFRKEMPRLAQTIQRSHFYYIPLGGKYNENAHTWSFPSAGGAKIQFAHMEGANDHLNYSGPQYTHVGFDELTEFTEVQYMFFNSRLRTPDLVLRKMLAMRAATNPVGIGLEWVRKRFVEPYPAGGKELFEWVTRPDGTRKKMYRLFIPAGLTDNPYLSNDDDYVTQQSMLPEHLKKAIRDGDWWVDVGSYFAGEWDKHTHVVRPFAIPESWPRFRSADYGYSAASSVSWWAVSPDDDMVCYRNLYVKKHTAEMLGWRVREIEEAAGDLEWDRDSQCSRLTGPLDRNCFSPDTGQNGPSQAEIMFNIGIPWFKGENGPFQRKPGWNQMRQRMIARRKSPILKGLIRDENDEPTKRDEFPMILTFSTCKAPTRYIPAVPADKDDPEDVDTASEDHCPDEWRMACMSRPISATKDQTSPWYEDDENDLARARASKRSGTMGYGGW